MPRCVTFFFLIYFVSKKSIACGNFHFDSPNIMNGQLLVKENNKLNVIFTLKIMNCSNIVFGSIQILKYNQKGSMYTPQCKISENCSNWPINSSISCICLDVRGYYSFSITARRQDSTKWKWTTTNKIVQDVVMDIVVTYPSRVTRLHIEGNEHPIPQNKIVSVSCSLDIGNPPTEVRLLDNHNNVLQKSFNTDNISYTFLEVHCQQAGIIKCEAEGSLSNMSAVMVVECPPTFDNDTQTFNMTSNEPMEITFPFRAHTSSIHSCHIMHNYIVSSFPPAINSVECEVDPGEKRVSNVKKRCRCLANGTPPDLRLSIQVYDLEREDAGLWRVTITNDKGGGHLYLHVNVNDDTESSFHGTAFKKVTSTAIITADIDNINTSEKTTSTNVSDLGAMGGIIALLILFILLYIGNELRKKGHRERSNERNVSTKLSNTIPIVREPAYEVTNPNINDYLTPSTTQYKTLSQRDEDVNIYTEIKE